jgi:hypothetical protein
MVSDDGSMERSSFLNLAGWGWNVVDQQSNPNRDCGRRRCASMRQFPTGLVSVLAFHYPTESAAGHWVDWDAEELSYPPIRALE